MTTSPAPPPMPAEPPAVPPAEAAPAPTPAPPSAPAPTTSVGGGILAPVVLARPTRDASGGSAAYASQDENGSTDGNPGKTGKNSSSPSMWKGLAAFIANRPQQKVSVQHTISEIRGSSTDRKINHGITEKRGATSDTKSARTATTANARKSDTSAKTADTRDAKTADTRDAKTADTRDAKTSATTAKANKNTRDDKSDRKDHDTRQQAGKTTSDTQDRTARDDKTSRKTDDARRQPEGKPDAVNSPPKDSAPGPATAPAPANAGDSAGDKPTAAKPDQADTKPEPPAAGPTAPAGPAPTGKQTKPRRGPYTAQPAREDGFRAGAQQAAAEADRAAWQDGYKDGQQAIRDKAARDKAQMDATRDRGVPPVPAKPTAQTVPPGPPAAPPVPASGSGQTPTAVPLGARVSGDTVQLSSGRTLTRGEVRSLRGFTRFLSGKQWESHQIADECKEAKEVSADRVKEIQELIERCQDPKIKGGRHLIAALQRLHEATAQQAREADLMDSNAQRGIEALRTLSHNAEARHGGVYRAVVDSPETSPAERAFYAR
ncbi:hypothetical protein ACFV0B_37810 [Streptomyces xanthophaeus]|uniref:hypothetical protein n=1 Tax=Streptomyces xanthophaeus TaxID=67385 RepID=UPI0036BDEFF5